ACATPSRSRRQASSRAARFGHRESEAARLEACRLLLEGVAQAFHGVQLAREGVVIAEGNAEFTGHLLQNSERLYEAGKGSRSDMLNFRVHHHKAQAMLLDTEGQYEAARVALAALMNLPEAVLPAHIQVAEMDEEGPEAMREPDVKASLAYAMTHRPALDRGEYSLERARAIKKQQLAAYAPEVTVFGAWNIQRFNSGSFGSDDLDTTLGVNVSCDLFTGGRRRAAVSEARHAERQAQYELAGAEEEVAADVQRALIALNQAQRELVLQRSATADIEENRALEEKAYNAGKGALTRLNQAQRDLIEARGRLALARVSVQQAWYELRSAMGATLEDFGLVGEGATEGP
ncbi:MAG TPA: TolC family protein, partial [Candidatus Hydrogenedentes bacterium]|nr:TolC family protein [Candidatus Hydrogenedentota bacterium]